MKYPVAALVVLLLVSALVPACAESFTLSLPWAFGSYGPGTLKTQTIDFGQSFSAISSVSMHWVGSGTAGYAYLPASMSYMAYPAEYLGWFSPDEGGMASDTVRLQRKLDSFSRV